jgi:hypothetical protein
MHITLKYYLQRVKRVIRSCLKHFSWRGPPVAHGVVINYCDCPFFEQSYFQYSLRRRSPVAPVALKLLGKNLHVVICIIPYSSRYTEILFEEIETCRAEIKGTKVNLPLWRGKANIDKHFLVFSWTLSLGVLNGA